MKMSMIRGFFNIIVKNFFSLRDWQVKLICLFLSLGLYFYVINEGVLEKSIEIPYRLVNQPKNLAIASRLPRSIGVVIRGKQEVIARVTKKSITAEIDLLNAQKGDNQNFPISLEKNDLPDGIDIISYFPEKASISFEEFGTKEVHVYAQIGGSLPEGYEIGKVSVNPPMITLNGPKSLLEKTNAVYLQKISIEGSTATVNKTLKIMVNSNLSTKAKFANVTIPVIESKGIRLISAPVQVDGIIDLDRRLTYKLEQTRVNIKVRIPTNVKDISAKDFRVWIDISGTAIDSQGNIVPSADDIQDVSIKALRKIDGLEVIGVDPERVRIIYTKKIRKPTLPGPGPIKPNPTGNQ